MRNSDWGKFVSLMKTENRMKGLCGRNAEEAFRIY